MEVQRTHDTFYAKESASVVKQTFATVANLINDSSIKPSTIADIGSAVGAFPNYLKQIFPRTDVIGYEFLEESVRAGNALFPELNLVQADILDYSFWHDKQYDVVTMLGVLCIFDDIDIPLANIKKILAKQGKLYIYDMFNPYPYDVNIKF